jgi:hypothetical protein
MRAVLGVLLLLVGFTVAYLVLSGKFPSQYDQAGQQIVNPPGINNRRLNNSSGSGPDSGVLGLPTMQGLHDYAASRGYA